LISVEVAIVLIVETTGALSSRLALGRPDGGP
jgi:hypothetical protein